MTISSVDTIASALAAPCQKINFMKNITVPKAIGSWQSSWLGTGNPGAGATAPVYTAGSGYTCDDATTGGFIYNNATVQNYLAKWFQTSVVAGTFLLMDRLWSCSGMGFAINTYTVTTPGELPARITDYGVGCELWTEQFVAAGSASGTLTCVYKNAADSSETGVIPAVVSSPLIGQMQQVPLQSGAGLSVRSLVSVANSATWTSGSWGMTICKRIAQIDVYPAAQGKTLDWAALALPQIPNDACLFLIWQGGAATASQVIGTLAIIDA
jgi:hypothetical protein